MLFFIISWGFGDMKKPFFIISKDAGDGITLLQGNPAAGPAMEVQFLYRP